MAEPWQCHPTSEIPGTTARAVGSLAPHARVALDARVRRTALSLRDVKLHNAMSGIITCREARTVCDAASIVTTNRVDSNAAQVAGRASTRWRDCFFRGRA